MKCDNCFYFNQKNYSCRLLDLLCKERNEEPSKKLYTYNLLESKECIIEKNILKEVLNNEIS